MQNNPKIQITFEQRLSDVGGRTGVPITRRLTPQIDQCSLPMETYVFLYGAADSNNLVFVPGIRYGSGSGAVDDYNPLCDILKMLCEPANQEGLWASGPVKKFQAKDIMAWHWSFENDAFTMVVPGGKPA